MSSPTAVSLFYSMQRDLNSAFDSLRGAVRSLLLRGQTLESLVDSADDLERAAIEYRRRSEDVRQRLLAEQRAFLERRRYMLFKISICSILFLCCAAAVVFGVYQR